MANERPTEIPEDKWAGPFGGIQSECSSAEIGTDGFADVQDMVCMNGELSPRPAMVITSPIGVSGQIIGSMDFSFSLGFDSERLTGLLFPNRLVIYIPQFDNWVSAGGTFTGSPIPYTTLSFANKAFLFSSGACSGIFKWDGNEAHTPAIIAGSPASRILGEMNAHVVGFNTNEGGQVAPQRVHWSGAGDETDWTSFSSGQTDLFNSLGPITGFITLWQTGFIFQTLGVSIMSPTGNSQQPFIFGKFAGKNRGLIYPHTLDTMDNQVAFFLGNDDVYMFDGTNFSPIGSMPLDGRRKIGARRAIFNDILTLLNSQLTIDPLPFIIGKCYNQSNLIPFRSYWISIPGIAIWVFNLDEMNWTRWTGPWPDMITTLGIVSNGTEASGLEIWPGELPLIGYNNGQAGLIEFGQNMLSPWSFKSGGICLGNDTRHSKNIKHVRFVVTIGNSGIGTQQFSVNITNEQGQTETHLVYVNSVPGTQVNVMVAFHIPAIFMTLTVSGDNSGAFKFSEIAVGYDLGAEIRIIDGAILS
jgi:hypothetical protein